MKVFEEHAEGIAVGQKAAGFRIDATVSLADLAGSPVFLVFWKSL